MAALFFHPDDFTAAGQKLMGRQAAGESFLRGYLHHVAADTLWAYVEDDRHGQAFEQAVAAAGRTEPVRLVTPADLRDLRHAGLLYRPDPGLNIEAWKRTQFGDGGWSLCGITHTTASAQAMDAIAALLTAPVQPWDALICTSTAVKANIETVFAAEGARLERRFGTRPTLFPQLPVIPLGIHTGDYAFDPAARARARQRLGADEQTLVVLYLGRLSVHAKAHPLAMYQALERARGALPPGHRVLLVECGWHANDSIAQAYAAAAALACPGVAVVRLDGRQAANRDAAWAGADIFCSLADSFQESFGLTPVEAMAAGLPVVVTDWDGYRDTVRDGIDGFRVPTLIPPPGTGEVFAIRYAMGIDSYDAYCGYGGAHVVVDIEACAAAFGRLFRSPELRRQMGAAGRARARAQYDWQGIIPQYQALWADLGERRATAGDQGAHKPWSWPARMDPFHGFAGYATGVVRPATRFVLADPSLAQATARLEAYLALDIVRYTLKVALPRTGLNAILARIAAEPSTTRQIATAFPPKALGLVIRAVAWLAKLGLVRPAGGADGAPHPPPVPSEVPPTGERPRRSGDA